MSSYTSQLIDSGLSMNQALIYELLIKNGPMRASSIVRRLDNSLSRPMVYLILNELIAISLIEKNDSDTKVARFSAAHPTKLQDFALQQKVRAEALLDATSLLIPKMVSEFNLHSNKPGVRFFEGKAGVEKVLFETLANPEETIYAYVDTNAVATYVSEINERYVQERIHKGIKKNILMFDCAEAREKVSRSNDLTNIRILKADHPITTQAVLEIHNNKVTYITFTERSLTATVMDDPMIYQLHRQFFESHWNL